MTVTTTRQTTARYYYGQKTVEHYTEAELPANEIVFIGEDVLVNDNQVLCEITPETHVIVDRTDVTLAE
jgi:hypothetical protein